MISHLPHEHEWSEWNVAEGMRTCNVCGALDVTPAIRRWSEAQAKWQAERKELRKELGRVRLWARERIRGAHAEVAALREAALAYAAPHKAYIGQPFTAGSLSDLLERSRAWSDAAERLQNAALALDTADEPPKDAAKLDA